MPLSDAPPQPDAAALDDLNLGPLEASVVYVDPRELAFHPDNYNQGDVDAIEASIRRLGGFYGTVIVQHRPDGSWGPVCAGEHRTRAAIQAGLDRIPVSLTRLTDAQARFVLAADNGTARAAVTDDAGLAALLSQIQMDAAAEGRGDALEGTGFGQDDLDEMLERVLADREPEDGEDDDPEEPEELDDAALRMLAEKWGAAAGQLWVFEAKADPGEGSLPLEEAPGRQRLHRMYVGDATDPASFERLLFGLPPAWRPRLLLTDPPYGVKYDPMWRSAMAEAGFIKFGTTREGHVENDDRADWSETYALAAANGAEVAYVWHAGIFAGLVQANLEACRFEIRNQVMWVKNSFSISRGAYHWRHEPCWYAVLKGKAAKWIGDRSQDTVWEVKKRQGQDLPGGEDQETHGTQKPLELFERPTRHHAGDVIDPFLGSGTALVAAERQGRLAYGFELPPSPEFAGYVGAVLERADRLGLSPRLAGPADFGLFSEPSEDGWDDGGASLARVIAEARK